MKLDRRIPRTVWVLGLVSLFMDLSSEIIHALLPLFMTATLGLSVAMVGLVDGIAEATANIVKVFSGYLSDRMGRRKPLILLGYGLAALSKPLFPLANGALPVLGARFADRIGKGLRTAPRDALIADISPAEVRGRAFGLRQSLDTVGALVGPLLAVALMLAFAGAMRTVFWIAMIPAFVAVLLVLVGVEDRAGAGVPASAPIRRSDLYRLGKGFWIVTGVGVLFSLARISEAFLVLKVHAEGLSLALAPLAMVAMSLVYALGAYPAGALSDRMPPRVLLLWGIFALIAADLLLAFAPGLAGAFAGIALWGLHMALTQGVLARMIADSAPPELRGSAFGVFSLLTGLAMFAASVIGGVLWDALGPQATFAAAAVFAAGSAIALVLRRDAGEARDDG
jgi:MFS family permease